MAQSTVLNEFFNVLKFKTDQASLNQAQTAIIGFRQMATKVLGALGVGLSLSWLRGITEEFSDINDEIRGATEGLGEQAEIQKKILASAQECRDSYGKMAGYVTELVQKNSTLFPIDDAVKFTSLVEKLEKGSGKSGSIANTMALLTKGLSSSKVDKTVFSQLEEKAPEVVKVIERATGKTKTQLEAMAKAGTLSANTIKKAILSAEDEIQKKFDNVDLNVTDAITHIRNSWGYWIEDIDSTYKLTDKLSRAIIAFSDKALDYAKKLKRWLDDIADKMGGYEKLLKLIAMAAAAVFIATHSASITTFLKGALGLITKINLQTILAAAKWLALFLIIEDIWTFFKGGDSVIGRLLEDAGVDVDYLRKTVLGFFENIKKFGGQSISKISEFWNEHKGQAKAVFDFLWTGFSDLLHDFLLLVIQISDLISGVLVGFQTGDWTQFLDALAALWQDFLDIIDGVGKLVFGELWDPMKESAQSLWDWLEGFFGWIGDKISALRTGWDNFKKLFTGGGSKTDDDGFGGPSGGKYSNGGTFGVRGSAAWKAGTGVSSSKVANSPVSSQKNVSIKQENNQVYTFKVDSTTAADKLQKETKAQGTQSANDLARVINYGR
nr:MAG TPA: Tape measure domain protein [Caudoviricetes sp.]